MTLHLKRGTTFDVESGVRYVQIKQLDKMTGQKEYAVTVLLPRGSSLRRVIPVVCDGDEPLTAWADTTTGQLYVAGQCLSGPLRFEGAPKATGRSVPSIVVRGREGQERSAFAEYSV